MATRALMVVTLLAACAPSEEGVRRFVLENGAPPIRIGFDSTYPTAELEMTCEDPGCNMTLGVFAWLIEPTRPDQVDLPGLNLVMLRFTAAEGTAKDWLLRRTTNVPDPKTHLFAPVLPPGPGHLSLVKSDANALAIEVEAWWGPTDYGDGPPEIEWSDEGIEQ